MKEREKRPGLLDETENRSGSCGKPTRENKNGVKREGEDSHGDQRGGERRLYCTVLFENRAVCSEDMFNCGDNFDGDDDDLFAVSMGSVKPEKHKDDESERVFELSASDCLMESVCEDNKKNEKEEEEKEEHGVGEEQSTKLRRAESCGGGPFPAPVSGIAGRATSAGVAAVEAPLFEPSFEASELFDSFFDRSTGFDPGLVPRSPEGAGRGDSRPPRGGRAVLAGGVGADDASNTDKAKDISNTENDVNTGNVNDTNNVIKAGNLVYGDVGVEGGTNNTKDGTNNTRDIDSARNYININEGVTNFSDAIVNDLITPTAAAQLMNSQVFDDDDGRDSQLPPTTTLFGGRGGSSRDEPTNRGQATTTTSAATTTAASLSSKDSGVCRTPSSAAKRFRSFDNVQVTPGRLDPDVEFVMRVFCDEEAGLRAAAVGGTNSAVKKWNKRAPKRHNSSNDPQVGDASSSRGGRNALASLSEIVRSPFEETGIAFGNDATGFSRSRPEAARGTSANASEVRCQSKKPIEIQDGYDTDDVIPPTPPGTPERVASKALCSGTTTPRRLLVGVVRPSPRASEGRRLVVDWAEPSANGDESKNTDDRNVTIRRRRRLDLDGFSTDASSLGIEGTFGPDSNGDGAAEEKEAAGAETLPSTGPSPSLESLVVCDVASDRRLFETFLREWRTRRRFSVCLACQRTEEAGGAREAPRRIGEKFRRKEEVSTAIREESARRSTPIGEDFRIPGSDLRVVGVAVSWSGLDVYYLSLLGSDSGGGGRADLDRSMAAPDLDPGLGVKERLEGIREVLEAKSRRNPPEDVQIAAYDAKAQYKALSGACGVLLAGGTMLDPKVACWMLDPGAREKSLHAVVAATCPHLLYLLEDVESSSGVSSLGMTPSEATSPRLRACLESILVRHSMDVLRARMEGGGGGNPGDGGGGGGGTGDADADGRLWRAFVGTEMPVVTLLAKMELNGMGFDDDECETQKSLVLGRISSLESSAYAMAGRPFSLTSPDEVGRVLFVELGLPPSGEPGVAPPKAKAARSRGLPRFSSAKGVLEKLTRLHPLAGVILEWRRLSAVVAKMVFPLQRSRVEWRLRPGEGRVHGVAETHTATGRVSMREPNLQNVPRDFSVAERQDGGKSRPVDLINESVNYDLMCLDDDEEDSSLSDSPFCVSMRSAFVPFRGGILLAADYSQLELRIIAHMSNDRKLIGLLNKGGDVFRAIAAQLEGVSDAEVTEKQRQHAKQICYGMIYGIGARSLGQQLNVDEDTASLFIDSFKSTYSGIRTFLHETVERCRRRGFVETIAGRRRYLPSIRDERVHPRAHAERQSVNTTIQGSAADIVKSAMLSVESSLVSRFPECRFPLGHLRGEPVDPATSGVQRVPRGAYLILQLHDELIYEVNAGDLPEVARAVKRGMEEAARLSVVLPVKLKVGGSWGKMADYPIGE